MSFFTNAIDVLQTLVIALGGGLCVWGGINLLEGYGQDNPASNGRGMKRLKAGGGGGGAAGAARPPFASASSFSWRAAALPSSASP